MGFKVYPLIETATSESFVVNPISLHDANLRTSGQVSSSGRLEGPQHHQKEIEVSEGRGWEAKAPAINLHYNA